MNDYLARRDAELLSPVYKALGLSVGILQMQMEDANRASAYRSDITYGTASEFGFDFLRDRLKQVGGNRTAQAAVLGPLGKKARIAGPINACNADIGAPWSTRSTVFSLTRRVRR